MNPAPTRQEAVADEGPNCQPAVGVANFLALCRGAWLIGNGNFRDRLAHSAKLRRNLGAEFETAAFKFYLRQQRSAKHFVASGLIVNVGTIEKICEMGQELRS